MTTSKKTTAKGQKGQKHATNATLQVRVDAELAAKLQVLSKASDATSVSDWVRQAIENEASRERLCKPLKPVSVEQVHQQVTEVKDLLASQDSQIRLQSELLKSVALALGIPA